jgi:hypothetical protein
MKKSFFSGLILFLFTIIPGWTQESNTWIVEKHRGYELLYTDTDKKNKEEYLPLIDNGINSVQNFFDASFKNDFKIFIHPDRQSLDTQWGKDWNIKDFKSECWMVASGVASRLDIISPKLWEKESCEHSFSDKIKTQQLITHELVHVFHGQLNISPDFSDVTGIDWFVEGLATYASGQCDSARINEVKKAIAENSIPLSLDSFWTGKFKYGLSGSVVMYIDNKFGRTQLKGLLKFNNKSELLDSLKITEADLLAGWVTFMKRQP